MYLLIYVVDQESRQKIGSSEWKLSPKTLEKICCKEVLPEIDLFASRLHQQLKKYIFW